MLSIESQVRELQETAGRLGLPVTEVLTEAMSAKAPGRPVFNRMMQRIYNGEANGIVCWKLDRLARNPVDGGSIIWTIKQHGIHVVTPSQTFSHGEDNVILMYIEFGMAQKYVDDLSRNVKRGLKTKIEKGGYPGVAPMGFLNHTDPLTHEKRIVKDPDRFPLLRRIWDLMLTGMYTPPQILELANQQWGFRTRRTRRTGGRALARSSIYKILSNPFYYGHFEAPRNSGHWHKGNHEPMVTQAEYDRVQLLLGRTGAPRPSKHRNFAFTGLIRCGECGAMVTAEVKHQIRCAHCRHKFSTLNRDACPACRTRIDKMAPPVHRHYTYYHCSHSKNPRCRQGSVTSVDLAVQVDSFLARITISSQFKEWALKHLHLLHEADTRNHAADTAAQRKALETCELRLDNLIKLKTSPENTHEALLTDSEYARQRSELMHDKARLEALMRSPDTHTERCLQQATEVFETAATARLRFAEGDPRTQREILATVGSNHILKNKLLSIEAAKPFRIIEDGLAGRLPDNRPIEPDNTGLTQGSAGTRVSLRPRWLGDRDSNPDTMRQRHMSYH